MLNHTATIKRAFTPYLLHLHGDRGRDERLNWYGDTKEKDASSRQRLTLRVYGFLDEATMKGVLNQLSAVVAIDEFPTKNTIKLKILKLMKTVPSSTIPTVQFIPRRS